jgi:hypothetical protein
LSRDDRRVVSAEANFDTPSLLWRSAVSILIPRRLSGSRLSANSKATDYVSLSENSENIAYRYYCTLQQRVFHMSVPVIFKLPKAQPISFQFSQEITVSRASLTGALLLIDNYPMRHQKRKRERERERERNSALTEKELIVKYTV